MINIGFDLDGILAIHTLHLNRKSGKDNVNPIKVYSTCIPQHIESSYTNNGNTIYIVTGRKETYRKLTLNWLKKNKFTYDKICFFQGKKKSFEELAKHKINVIRQKKIQVYYEDTPEIAVRIKTEVPECKVLLLYNKHLLNLEYLG